MNQQIPRPEYPRPQFVRAGWMNLNGVWQFEMDQGDSGRKRGLVEKKELAGSIMVPFCPESELSGIGYKDFIRAVWYKRSVVLPEEAKGKRVLLHFGAVDYLTEVWVNGKSVGTHKGGYTSFCFDITDALQEGENLITVCAQDDTRSGHQPSGKQSHTYESYGCFYTRTTGIWQTVWMEWVDACYIKEVYLTPHAEEGTVTVRAIVSRPCTLSVRASYEGAAMGEARAKSSGSVAELVLPLSEKHLWNVGDPKLYDL
ncbi:MAG: beta-galactosidase, partial [Clostridia bacterium]|nr:beta-galactosidase [Clostridia bacterium]